MLLFLKHRNVYLRNKSWKPECVGSFNMDWRILVFYPEPEARDEIYQYPPIHLKTQNTFWLPWFITILICLRVLIVHTCEPSGGSIFLPILRVPSVPPSTFKIFRPWKKSSTKKSWPTFCDQYFWKFPIWTDEKRREIRMVKVNVIFNDIRLLICLTPLQVNWVMAIN